GRCRNSALKSGRKHSRRYRLAAATVRMPAAPQFVDQPSLQRAIHPFTAAAGLRRVAEDVFDAEPGEGPPELGQPAAIGRGAGYGRVDRPVGAVRIEGPGYAPRGDDVPQGGHDAGTALAALEKLSVEDVLGRVVDDREQGERLLGDQREPVMTATV